MNTSDISGEALGLSLLATEAWLEEAGWDALPVVLALVPELEGLEDIPPLTYSQERLIYLNLGEGDPYEILEGGYVPEALAVLVATEGWAWPEDLPDDERMGRPSEHPNRIGVRTVVALTHQGSVLSVRRVRGEEPILEQGGSGPLLEAMRAVMEGRE